MSQSNSFLTTRMRRREQTHRRLVLSGIGALLLLSLSPVVGHHVSTGLDAALMGHDHLLDVCLIALHTLLAPVHGVFHLLLATGVMYATYERTRAVWQMRRTLSLLGTSNGESCGEIAAATSETPLSALQVRIVDGLPNPAFTAGWWNPKVYVDRSLRVLLSHAELVAVLTHEAEHVRRRDPLRLSLLRFLGNTLFWIPAFRRLAADIADESEIHADDVAARDNPLVLASAILSLAHWRQHSQAFSTSVFPQAGVSLVAGGSTHAGAPNAGVHDALLERRIRRLAGESAAMGSHLTRRSLASAAAVLCVVWISGVIVSHPMPTAGLHSHAAHCDHPGEGALSHLFCRNGLLARTPEHDHSRTGVGPQCPHTEKAA